MTNTSSDTYKCGNTLCESHAISLCGKWRMKAVGEDSATDAQIPGDNFSALEASGRIPNPFWRENEAQVQWVADKDWIFEREFEVDSSFLAQRSIWLSFDSIDTVAEIFINGQRTGTSENQFLRARFNVKKFLWLGKNVVEVKIKSPRIAANEAHSILAPDMEEVAVNNGTVRKIYCLRKSQCSGGWDWGISLPTSGMAGDISLFGAESVLLDSAWCEQVHRRGACKVIATARLIPIAKTHCDEQVPVVFTLGAQKRTVFVSLSGKRSAFEVSTTFTIENPELWWPRGFGPNPCGDRPLVPFSIEADRQKIANKIGLRKLEIITAPDKNGNSFKIRVNGVDIFAKGADWIPCDARPAHETRSKIRNLLESAAAANMNTIRLWGGGHFESDFFYEECDRLGLLVWHDMMMACMRYPSHPAFIANLRAEILYQVRRLRNHVCIALWCGDNECVGAIHWQAKDRSPEARAARIAQYAKLNRAVGRAVATADPSRLFWPSSPSAGPGNFVYNDANSGKGDTHFWGVWHGGARFEAYYGHKPRFCSEFGYQSFPSIDTVRTFADPGKGDFNLFSPVMDRHQKHASGNAIILGMFGNYFRMPRGFKETLFLSQVQQAVAIQTGVSWWRSMRPYCMGTIFWQLNDNWPVASWSSIEYGGRWKALQYAARRFYAPNATFVFRTSPDAPFQAFAVCDNVDLLKRAKFVSTIQLRRLTTGELLEERKFVNIFKQASSKRLALPDIARETLPRLQVPEEECFLYVQTHISSVAESTLCHEDTVFLAPWKRCSLPVANVRIADVCKTGNEKGDWKIELRSEAPAFFTWLSVRETEGQERFSDNLFTLLPEQPKTVCLSGGNFATPEELLSRVSLMDLRSTYD